MCPLPEAIQPHIYCTHIHAECCNYCEYCICNCVLEMYTGDLNLRGGRSGDRISLGAGFSASVQGDPGAHPVSCTVGTGLQPIYRRG
jgi:hypothetical protein